MSVADVLPQLLRFAAAAGPNPATPARSLPCRSGSSSDEEEYKRRKAAKLVGVGCVGLARLVAAAHRLRVPAAAQRVKCAALLAACKPAFLACLGTSGCRPRRWRST